MQRPPADDCARGSLREKPGDEDDPQTWDREQDERNEVVDAAKNVGALECADKCHRPGAARHEVSGEDARTGEHDDRRIDAQDRDGECDPASNDTPRPRPDAGEPRHVAGILRPSQRREHRPDVGEQVGYPDEIAQNPVSIHPNKRHELVEQLHVGEHDEDEQWRIVRGEKETVGDRDDDRVEVHTAEIGSDP